MIAYGMVGVSVGVSVLARLQSTAIGKQFRQLVISFTASKRLQRHQLGWGHRPMLATERRAMMAKVCLYLYIVLAGCALLLQQPAELALAIGP
jgi:hypothetical protein